MSTISAKARAIQKRSVKHLFRICRLSYDVHNPAFRCRPISYHCRNSTKIPSLIHSHNSRLLPLNKTNSFYSPVQNHLKFSTLSTTFSALPFPLKLATIVLSIPLCIYTYKSLVLILLQNKLIYMNYLPINSRHRMDMNSSEVGLSCTESTVQVEKGVKLQTWVLQDAKKDSIGEEMDSDRKEKTKVLVYFQG
ncbi:hypothetical protein BKA69DRAFT_899724 [Paraphysoderma sedebokerense]|nr:hypothetical protein BKA69DRAFT_899724 [Paraphysoderma sedebokerense]